MATVVIHKESKQKYILIGTGYGTYVKSDPSTPFGFLLPYEENGELPVAAVCDKEGFILWFPTNELRVLQIDDMNVNEIFNNLKSVEYNPIDTIEKCPACGSNTEQNDKTCPACGIALL